PSIGQVQRVLDQVIRAVEFLFGFTLAAGLVVLFAAITATREARAREFAVMRAMGASGRLLAQVQRAELLGVGALAGVLASLAAIAVGWALARYAFEFSWNASPAVPPTTGPNCCGTAASLPASTKPTDSTRADSQRGTPRSCRTWPLPASSTAPRAACVRSASAFCASRAACARAMPGHSGCGS